MKYLLYFGMLPLVMLMDVCNATPDKKPMEADSSELHYIVREAKATAGKAPVLVLLHGFGSNEKDLFSLASQIPDNWLVVAVRAPIDLGGNRFKWYDVKLVNEKITMNFDDEERSRKSLLNLIDQVVKKYNADEDRVVTAGFSQGANMALGLALTAPDKVLAAGCFSGRFMEEIKPLIKKETLKSKQVFLAHGTKDTMLPLRYLEENQAILEGWGIEVTQSLDQVAHSISGKQLTEFVAWMKAL